MRPRSLCFVFAALAVVSMMPARAQWRALAQLRRQGARVSAVAVDLETGRTIEQLDAAQRLTPASLTKLVTASAALQAWTPDMVFRTRLIATGLVRGDTLQGNLVVLGAGDPTLDDQSLWQMAAQVRGAGIRVVTGDLRIDPLPFGQVACGDLDRCAALQRSDDAYNAPLAAFGVDFGTWCVRITPTWPGAAAQVRGCGVSRLPIPVAGAIRTVPRGDRQTFWVERRTGPGGDRLQVGGDIPLGEDQRVYRAMSDPVRGAGLLLKETLREIGVRVEGPVVVRDGPAPREPRVLAGVEGLPVAEQLWRMLQYSNNYIADVLTLDMGSQPGRPDTLVSASQRLSDFMVRVQRSDPPAVSAPPLYSGSGLSTDNRLSANDLANLLSYEYHDARHFPAFYGGLVVPRDAPFAFLRQGDAAWLDRVAIKTGTLDDPRSVCGIAGYLRKRDGGWIAFAAIVNGGPRFQHVPLYEAIGAERHDIEALARRY